MDEKEQLENIKKFLAWVVDAQEFVPLTEGAKWVVDQLIRVQQFAEED